MDAKDHALWIQAQFESNMSFVALEVTLATLCEQHIIEPSHIALILQRLKDITNQQLDFCCCAGSNARLG